MTRQIMLFNGRIKDFLKILTVSKSKDRDSFRREYILNILLLGSIFLSLAAVVFASIKFVNDFPQHRQLYQQTYIYILGIFVAFLLGYIISRKGKAKIIAYILVLVYFFAATYTGYTWGADNPGALLIYSLVIVISGILISSRFAFFITLCVSISVVTLIALETFKISQIDKSWTSNQPTFGNGIVYGIIFFVIGIVSWLSNREIEKSLKRARSSERELKKERDLLEIKVEERTQELKKIQLERVTQLYRFAEVGKLTSGFMHDLVNPISLISLNLHRLNRESQQKELAHINIMLKRAMSGTRYLENFVTTARKQLQNQEIQKTFSLNNEMKHVIQILNFKANKARVKIVFDSEKTIKFFGNPIKFNQIAMNLILNAIDAYEKTNRKDKIIKITLNETERQALLTVQDFGVGITKENIKKIFDPFFTTKTDSRGTGIGLSITKNIVKQTFKGNIFVKSNNKAGTIFVVKLPKHYPKIIQGNERD